MKTQTTTAAYWRTHGKAPRGRGGWAFQRSTTRTSYTEDRYGETEFFNGTFTEASKQARAAMTDAEFSACLG
jgi:hypothetical protein